MPQMRGIRYLQTVMVLLVRTCSCSDVVVMERQAMISGQDRLIHVAKQVFPMVSSGLGPADQNFCRKRAQGCWESMHDLS